MHPEVGIQPEFQLQPKVAEEFLVSLAVVVQHGQQLAVDLLLQPPGDDLQLAVVLQHLARDVQRQILRIDQALDEPEIVRQEIGALVHDQHAAGIQLQALFVLAGVIVERCARRDEQQRVVRRRALGGGIDHARGVLVVAEFLFIERVVLLGRDLVFVLLPQRDHAV